MKHMSRHSSITSDKGLFHLRTAQSSYLFRVTAQGHLEHIHFGAPVRTEDAGALARKRSCPYGTGVAYAPGDEAYCLDVLPLEWSGEGRGDYRPPPIELRGARGGYTTDFRHVSHEIVRGGAPMEGGLPQARGAAETLRVLLRDGQAGAALTLVYSVFPEAGVLTRRAVLENVSAGELELSRLLSFSLDLCADAPLVMGTLEGGWIAEAHIKERAAAGGTLVNESRTGFSSNRANPAFYLREAGADEARGRVWGFNLVYSGSHYGAVSQDAQGGTRIMAGLQPSRFRWTLAPGARFETPEAVLCFSGEGLGGMSRAMHRFVHAHIVRGPWAGRERPVLVNAWEAFMFDYDEAKLLGVARRAARLGAELFVLDDGWFRGRDHDRAGLGDYAEDREKLPEGLAGLGRRIRGLGLDFGLWVEPEAVNEDSALFRAHPDWAVTDPGREPVRGRHELHLDLTRAEVRDYLAEQVGAAIDRAGAAYVKWDMNRHLAGRDGAFAHRYILGLYELLGRIFGPRPEVLLESCASGGNRFDLGMLCFSPQVWASDDTDPIERLDIQKGLSYFYPLSTMGAHVSASPHAQTLRHTPLATRFHAACFGCLGYELDLRALTPAQAHEVRAQIRFYKAHRRTFQFGTLYRAAPPDGREGFTVVAADGREAVCGHFRRLVRAAPPAETLPAAGLEPEAVYEVAARPQRQELGSFGRLVSHALPLKLAPEGAVMRAVGRRYALRGCREAFTASGAALLAGVRLENLFNGAGYNGQIRLPGDFGSELYLMTRVGKTK